MFTRKVNRLDVNTAASEIVQRCPNEKVAYIWYDECTLRYSNESSFSTVVYMWNTQNVADPTRFYQLLGDTINEAATEAASDSERFATREANFTQFQQLYCLTQCSPDLSGKDCNRCLIGAIGGLPTCCSGKQGGRVLNPSCNVRYEVYPFYHVTASAPAPSPTQLVSSPSPSHRTTFPEKQGSSSGKIVAIVVPVAAAGVTISFVLWYCLRIQKKKEGLSKENGRIFELD